MKRVALIAVATAVVLGAAAASVLLTGTASRSTNRHVALTALLAPIAAGAPGQPTDPVIAQASSALLTAPQLASQLGSQGVALSVDGSSISLADLALHAVGFAHNNIVTAAFNAQRLGLDERTAVDQAGGLTLGLQQAAAFEVLSELAFATAQAAGDEVDNSTAAAFAQNNLTEYEKDYSSPSAFQVKLPPPNPADFTSPSAVAGYQYTMTVDQEFTRIAGPQTGKASRTPALAQWMKEQLATHGLRVAGIPGVTYSTISSMLPESL
ncbi:MAG TPA: hypothetical protein VFB34_06820 [Chloroflexota bacterium]|nr:hypothetical protein [Chloroflexota bacterium]